MGGTKSGGPTTTQAPATACLAPSIVNSACTGPSDISSNQPSLLANSLIVSGPRPGSKSLCPIPPMTIRRPSASDRSSPRVRIFSFVSPLGFFFFFQMWMDGEFGYLYGIPAVDGLRSGIKLEPFFSLGVCFQLFVADCRFSGRSVAREQRIVFGADLTVEGAEIRLAIGKMRGPGDPHGSCAVAGPGLADRMEFSVTSFFLFKNCKPP